MATPALSSASIRRLMKYIRQHEATTGQKMSQTAIDSLMRQEIEVAASRATESRALELRKEEADRTYSLQQEQLKMQKQRDEDAADAARASGYAQIGGTAIQAGMLLKDTETGKAIAGGVKGLFGATEGAALGETTQAVLGASDTAVSGIQAGQIVNQPVLGATAANTSQAAVTGGVDAATPSVTTTTSGTSVLGTVGGSATAAGLGRTIFGQSGDSTAKDIGTIGSGALYGWYTFGPVGAIVGGVVGAAYDLVADDMGTIICTELHRQGLMSIDTVRKDREYRIRYVEDEVYHGYLILAEPVVELMRKSKVFTYLIAPFAKAWAKEAASKIDGSKGSYLGKVINYIGQPICRWRAKWRVTSKV